MTEDEITPLDAAHAAMEAAPGEDGARLRFYERLADAELFLLLAAEAEGDQVEPEVFALDAGRFVLAFDREARLARFTGRAAPYAGLSGRSLAALLSAEGLGLGLNLDVAPSSILIPAEAIAWLSATLGHGPAEAEARIEAVSHPGGLPEALLAALDAKLATAQGLAQGAYLAGVTYEGGGQGHLLAFVDAVDGAQPALARAANEALTFSGLEAGAMDVVFVSAGSALAQSLGRVGLRVELPRAQGRVAPVAPGSDPARPPILR